MPALAEPTPDVAASFIDAMAEFSAEGRGGVGDNSMIGAELREYGIARWSTPDGFAAFVARLRAHARGQDLPAGYVPCTTLWWLDDDTYLGRIAIRHELTPGLLRVGGHIGYDVRPTARRRGHATAMLRAALPVARDLGIDRVLITCATTNIASRKVIESAGGRLADERAGTLRYWVG